MNNSSRILRSGPLNHQGLAKIGLMVLLLFCFWPLLLSVPEMGMDQESQEETTDSADIFRFTFTDGVYNQFLIGDIDNDRDYDILLISGVDGESPAILVENQVDTFVLADLMLTDVFSGGRGYGWGDIDNDNDLDLIVSGLNQEGEPASILYKNRGNGSFVNTNAHIENLFESSTAFGDLDNDGDQDLLMCGLNIDGRPVTRIYKNLTNGSYVESPEILDGLSSGSVLICDIDNDLDTDIVINGYDEMLRKRTILFRNEGNKGYTTLEDALPAVGCGMWKARDINKDGLMDLIGIDGAARKLIVAYSTPVFTYSISNYPLSYRDCCRFDIVDFNANGQLDILLASGEIYEISDSIEPSITFLEAGFEFEKIQGDVAWTDWNGEGEIGIIGSHKEKTGISFFEGQAEKKRPTPPNSLFTDISGTTTILNWSHFSDNIPGSESVSFNLRVGATSGGSEIVSPMADSSGFHLVYDLGNCGLTSQWKLENLAPGKYYWSVQAIAQVGLGSEFAVEDTFTVKSDFSVIELVSSSAETLSYVYPFDIDNDGDYEFISSFRDLNGIGEINGYGQLIRNHGDFKLQKSQKDSLLEGFTIYDLQFGDFNGDGFTDVAMGVAGDSGKSNHSSHLVFLENQNGERLAFAGQQQIPMIISQIHDLDFDRDGDTDIVLVGVDSSKTGGISLFENRGNFVFRIHRKRQLPGLNKLRSETGDFNNDGIREMILSADLTDTLEESTPIRVSKAYKFESGIEDVSEFAIPETYDKMEAGDFNSDGYLDLLTFGTSSEYEYVLNIYKNSEGKSLNASNPGIPGINSNGFAAVGDFNFDNKADIFTLNQQTAEGGSEIGIYISEGSGYSQRPSFINNDTLLDSFSRNIQFVLADLDADNDPDLLVGATSDSTSCTIILINSDSANTQSGIPKPSNLRHTPLDHGVSLNWDSMSKSEYYFNVRVGTTPGGFDVVSPNSDPNTGDLRFPHKGNAECNNEFVLNSLDDGTYYWSVQAITRNKSGGPWSDEESVLVGAITLDFGINGNCSGELVSFIDVSSGPVSDWYWTFGDGNSDTVQNPVHTYDLAGDFEVVLQTEYEDFTFTKSKIIHIDKGISVDFQYQLVDDQTDVHFENLTDTSGISVIHWLWDFGDGSHFNGFDPGSYQYSNQNIYDVNLNAKTIHGCSDSVTKELRVCKELLDIPEVYVRGPNIWYFACSDASAGVYRWYRDGELIPGANEAIYVAGSKLGTYLVEISKYGFCFTQSDPVTIPPGLTGNIKERSVAWMEVFPNPSKGSFQIDLQSEKNESVCIEVTSLTGARIIIEEFQPEMAQNSFKIDLSSYEAGIYILKVRQGASEAFSKIILVN